MLVRSITKYWLPALVALVAVLAMACGGSAAPTQETANVQATNTPPPQAQATAAPTATPPRSPPRPSRIWSSSLRWKTLLTIDLRFRARSH